MSLNIFWFLPTHGDGKYLGTSDGARAVDHGYLKLYPEWNRPQHLTKKQYHLDKGHLLLKSAQTQS